LRSAIGNGEVVARDTLMACTTMDQPRFIPERTLIHGGLSTDLDVAQYGPGKGHGWIPRAGDSANGDFLGTDYNTVCGTKSQAFEVRSILAELRIRPAPADLVFS
jgi:hypothetical protein